MRRHGACLLALLALAGLAPGATEAQFQGKRGAADKPQEAAEESGSARRFIRPSSLVPAFPADAACPEIASPFGAATRYDGSPRPPSRYGGLHGGIDLSLADGTPLRAIAAGRIVAAGTGGLAEGNYLWLQHAPQDTGLPFWVYTKYQHLREVPGRALGEAVAAGEVVALSGSTGTAGPHYGLGGYPHLHLTTLAAPGERYERQGSRIAAEGGRIFDPLAVYVPGLRDLKEVAGLPEERKRVPIPHVANDGTIHPPGSRLVWPVGCGKR